MMHERVFYLKFNNWDLFKVSVDNQWNLCPVATEFDSKLTNKKWEPSPKNVLLSNNLSCIKYLENKLDGEVKAKKKIEISWNDRLKDYTLTSYWRTSSIDITWFVGI